MLQEKDELDNIYILKKYTEVTNYDEYSKGNVPPKKINLFGGTMIILKLYDGKFAYITIQKGVQNLHPETGIWICEYSCLMPVNKDIYPFILAIPCGRKLKFLKNIKTLPSYAIGDCVLVKLNNDSTKKKNHVATVRFVGEIPEKGPGIYFGLQLATSDGYTDGTYRKKRYFNCPKQTGVFVAIDEMTPIIKGKMSKYTKNSSNTTFYAYGNNWNSENDGRRTDKNQISTDKNHISTEKKGKTLHYLASDSSTQVNEIDLKKDCALITPKNSTIVDTPKLKYGIETPSISPDNGSNESENGYELRSDERIVIGSAVEIIHNRTPHFGVIRWIGMIDGELKAGIEMDKEDPEFTDGFINNQLYFSCEPNTGFFVNINECRLDSRLSEGLRYESRHNEDKNRESPVVDGVIAPISINSEVPPPISGKYKGIQGHHNSCYLDATLFSMFTFTSVFDSLLYRPPCAADIGDYKEVQSVLRDEIVNALRKNNFVSADRVMKLRRLMEKLSSVSGLTTEEKDPEEFLTSLVAQILKVDPFLKLSSGQEAFLYQLFVEKDEKLALPSVQQLFEQSFYSSDIKLKEVPACLIIQMPRFGKSYKMYPRILPSQLLDVTDVIENSPRHCFVCGTLAKHECRDCFDGLASNPEHLLENTAFCTTCVTKAHKHVKRANHKWRSISSPSFIDAKQATPRLFMELFAVVCIETSHYVTFVKCGEGSEAPWCFFDSMADREGEQDGFNIPEVVMCPDLPEWLTEKGALNFQPFKDSELPEHAKRLFCDAYMCMYQSPEVMMYR